ncbi:MAG: phenylalanine--tRNA ligase subunit alpha, partial [Bacteroidales bacterium]|nr:phenylalanine--tRNA ligase subunit alpha [Bacteroidales bacterium]
MKDKIQNYIKEIQALKAEALQNKIADIEQFRIKFLGKKGIISELFGQFKDVPNDQKKEIGQLLNQLKMAAQNKIEELKDSIGDAQSDTSSSLDLTMPTDFSELGSRHVLSVVQNEIIDIFSRIGFTVSEAPEIEDDW